MTDIQKPMAAARSVISEACKEMNEADTINRIVRRCDEMAGLIKDAADGFNALRSQIASLIGIANGFRDSAVSEANALKRIAAGDFGCLIDDERDEKFVATVAKKPMDVEDADSFAVITSKITGMRRPKDRLLACISVNEQISQAIASWQSKIDKMKIRSSADGSSPSEIEAAKKAIVKFGWTINILKTRGGIISDIYYDASHKMTKFIANCKESFKPIYPNVKGVKK